MNAKIVLAFIGGSALAGVLAFVLSKQSESKPEPTVAMSTAPTILERPVEGAKGNAADVAAGIEAVRPRPVDSPQRDVRLPKPAPVVVKKGSVAKPVKTAADSAPTVASSDSGVILPPFSTGGSNPVNNSARADTVKREDARPDPVVKQAPRNPETVTIPVGTSISVRINSTLNSEKNVAGDTFTAVLDAPLLINDIVLAERGARVEGKVVEVERSGRVKGLGRLTIGLTKIQLSDGQRVDVTTDPWEREAESTKKADAVKIGVMSAIGAAIGAIAGGGKGAAVGAGTGAGAGTGVVLATKGKAAQIDVETRIPFRLSNPLTVTEKIR